MLIKCNYWRFYTIYSKTVNYDNNNAYTIYYNDDNLNNRFFFRDKKQNKNSNLLLLWLVGCSRYYAYCYRFQFFYVIKKSRKSAN